MLIEETKKNIEELFNKQPDLETPRLSGHTGKYDVTLFRAIEIKGSYATMFKLMVLLCEVLDIDISRMIKYIWKVGIEVTVKRLKDELDLNLYKG